MSNEIIVSEEYTRAVTLTRSIIANAQAAQQSLYEVCKGLKEMKDGKLYRELGYQNFEEYCETEVGVKRNQAYRYVAIAENLSRDFVSSMIQIGSTKLTLLARLDESERTEIQQNVDVESVTVKELKAEISALHQKNGKLEERAGIAECQLDAVQEQLTKKDKQFKAAMESKQNKLDTIRRGADALKQQNHQLSEQVAELETHVEELESRPIEVAVSTEEAKEIENLKSILKQTDLRWSMELTKKEDEFTEIRRKDYQQSQAEIAAVREEYEKKLADAQNSGASEPDLKEIFNAYLANAIDAVKRMTAFLADHQNEACRAQAEKFFTAIIQEVKA